MRVLVLMAAVALAAPALADSVADEADFRFRRAATLYRAGRIEEALGEFLASNRLVKNHNVAWNIARSFEQLKRFNEAYRWYVEILAEPGLPVEDRNAVGEALKRLGNSLALVLVESEPQGATVYIDRKDLGARGQTPVTLALPSGKTRIFLELEGYRPAETQTSAETGMVAEVHHRLEPILGVLHVEGEPAQFELRLDRHDGEVALERPGQLRLSPGPHRLYVGAPGSAPQQLEVRIPPDGEARVSFKLIPLPPPSGAIVVRANVDSALVRVDGKEEGFTPAVIDKVRAGTHKLEVLADGREPLVMAVEVKADERTPVEARLRYALPRVQAAERTVTRAEDAPASISIITAAEIRGFGYATLAEALRGVRGLFTSSDRDYESLGVRGYSVLGTYNNKVLVLSDGHITNDLSLGQGFIGRDFDTDLNDVERIEIVRGPGSVLYGSAAFFAVINVVHRTPALGLHASGGATFLNETGAGAVVSSAAEGRWVSLHAGVFHSDGESLFHSPMVSGPVAGIASDLDSEDAAHADLRARYGEMTFYASVNDRGKALPTAPFNTVFGLPGTATHDARFFGEVSWAHTFDNAGSIDARFSLDGRRHHSTWEYRGPDALGHPGSSGRIADWGEAEVRWRPPEFLHNRIFVGADVQDVWRVRLTSRTPVFSPAGVETGSASAPDLNYSETVLSAWAGDDVRITQRIQLDAAVRVDDHHDSFGVVANPRLALIAQPWEGGNFKLMYGTAYRAPSFYERFFANGTTQLPGNRCNSDGTCFSLEPERVRTGEFELTHSIGESTSLLLAGHWSRIAKIIRLAQISATQFAFGNRGSLTFTSGIEAEARWQPEPGALVSLWYAWAHVFNEALPGSNGTQRFVVPNVPTHTAALRLLWPVSRELLSVSSELLYASSRFTVFVDNANQEMPVGEELIWNVGFTGTLGRHGPRFTLLVQNMLDQKPLLPAGLEVPFAPRAVPQPGRTFRATLGGSF